VNSIIGDPRGFYRCHVFCCTNERPAGHARGSCAGRGAVKLRDYMKARAKELGLTDVRINAAGCLDRCELGPTVVVYPEGVWYRCERREDVEEILQSHLKRGERVWRLMLAPEDRSIADWADRVGAVRADGQ
jgi:(2Fe-2S) ferredoxin